MNIPKPYLCWKFSGLKPETTSHKLLFKTSTYFGNIDTDVKDLKIELNQEVFITNQP